MGVKIIEEDGKKYIDGEEILCIYECANRALILLIRLPLFSFISYFFYTYLHEVDKFSLLWFLAFLFFIMPMWYIYRDIKNFYHEGFYITNKHLVTFRGLKVPLNDIYFGLGSGGTIEWLSVSLSLYENNSYLIQCIVKDDDDFRKLIKVLFQISNNKLFNINESVYDNGLCKNNQGIKQKLIKGNN